MFRLRNLIASSHFTVRRRWIITAFTLLMFMLIGIGYTKFHHLQYKFDLDKQIAVLVITAHRPLAIREHLRQLLLYRPSAFHFPIVISQEGNSAEVTEVIKEFLHHTNNEEIYFIQLQHHSTASSEGQKTNARIAQHYKWSLDKIFVELNHTLAIVTEEDLKVAEDFFSYFAATSGLLSGGGGDPSIWCVSAWNDHGVASDLEKGDRLYRTDFFPGLGWMLARELWVEEFSAAWPGDEWDHWIRSPQLVEIYLPYLTAASARYAGYYDAMLLPAIQVDFSTVNMSRLEKANYDVELMHFLQSAKVVTLNELLSSEWENFAQRGESYRVVYANPAEYQSIAQKFKLYSDIFFGMPRTVYCGVVTFTTPNKSLIYALHPALNLRELEAGKFGHKCSSIYDMGWDRTAELTEKQFEKNNNNNN